MNILNIILTSIFTVILFVVIFLIVVFVIFNIFVNKKESKLKIKDVEKIVFKIKKIHEDEKTSMININDESVKLYDVIEGLNNLLKEKNIKEIIIDVENVNLTKSQIDELSPIFKKLNKKFKVSSIASNMDNLNYMIALLADNVYMYKSLNSMITLNGYYQVYSYFKKFLQKIGVKMNVIHIGDFKGTGENFNRDFMSDERRISIKNINDKFYKNFTDYVKERRNIDVESLINNNDLSFVGYEEAIKFSLIDGVYTHNDFKLDYEKDTMLFTNYISNYKKEKNKSKNIIGVISLEGNISSKSSDESISFESVDEKVNKLLDIDNLKGVILKVNSPGGSALESEKIYQRLKDIKVPLYVSMSDVCASGGYYISMAADKIFANTSTITGSIGVVLMYPEFSELAKKLEINQEFITNGHKEINFFEPLTEDLKIKITEQMKKTYIEFKDRVINSRKIDGESLEKIAQGKIWIANDAKEIGLIDEVGNFEYCLNSLVKDLKLKDYKINHILNEKKLEVNPEKILKKYIMNNSIFFDKNEIMYYEDYQSF